MLLGPNYLGTLNFLLIGEIIFDLQSHFVGLLDIESLRTTMSVGSIMTLNKIMVAVRIRWDLRTKFESLILLR